MPFSRRGGRNPRGYGRPNNLNTSSGASYASSRNYGGELTGTRRHNVTETAGVSAGMLGDYTTMDLVKMRRTFSTTEADIEPTATSSNNFSTTDTMNGSRVSNYECIVRMQNKDSDQGVYLDVYALTTSFFTAANSQLVNDSESILEFTDAVGTSDRRGEVAPKGTHIIFSESAYKARKQTQSFQKLLGTIYLSSEDGGSPQSTFTIRGVPPQVRRMQTGAYYGLMFHLDSIKNSGNNYDYDISGEISFMEHPSSNRLPYKW